MSECLPTLSDDQIDAAWRAMWCESISPSRDLPSWKELRRAFPRPVEPPPRWEHMDVTVMVAESEAHSLPDHRVGVWVASTYTLVSVGVAREMADALSSCADWIDQS